MPRARSRGWTGSRHPGQRPARRLHRPAPGWARAACQPRRSGDLSRLRGTGLTPSTRGQPRQEGAARAAPPTNAPELGAARPRGAAGSGHAPGTGSGSQAAAPEPGRPWPLQPRRSRSACSAAAAAPRSPPGSAEPAEGTFLSPRPRSGVPRGGGSGGTDPRLLSVGERGARGRWHRALSATTGTGNCPRAGTPRLDPRTTEGSLASPDSPPAEGSPSSPVSGGTFGTPASGAPPDRTILPVPAAAPAGASRQREGGAGRGGRCRCLKGAAPASPAAPTGRPVREAVPALSSPFLGPMSPGRAAAPALRAEAPRP